VPAERFLQGRGKEEEEEEMYYDMYLQYTILCHHSLHIEMPNALCTSAYYEKAKKHIIHHSPPCEHARINTYILPP